MNKRITDRYSTVKRIKIEYRTEIPSELLDKLCLKHRIGRNDAVNYIKCGAIKAAEIEIDNMLMEVQNVNEIYDNRE